MSDPAISFVKHVYEPLRAQGVALADDQVVDVVRRPDLVEVLTSDGDATIQVRAAGGSCGVVDTFALVLSADTASTIDVFFSIVIPAYLRELVGTPTGYAWKPTGRYRKEPSRSSSCFVS